MDASNEIVRAIDGMWSSITYLATWEAAKGLANSAFFASLVAALAGAFASAFAAQRIAERGKYREELLREIRNTNAAFPHLDGEAPLPLHIRWRSSVALTHSTDRADPTPHDDIRDQRRT